MSFMALEPWALGIASLPALGGLVLASSHLWFSQLRSKLDEDQQHLVAGRQALRDAQAELEAKRTSDLARLHEENAAWLASERARLELVTDDYRRESERYGRLNEELAAEIREYRSRQRLEGSVEELTAEVGQLDLKRQTLERLVVDLEGSRAEVERLRGEEGRLGQAVDGLRRREAELGAQVDHFERVRMAYDRLERELGDLRADEARLRIESENLRDEYRQMLDRNVDLAAQISRYQEQERRYDELQTRIAGLLQEQTIAEGQRNAVQADLAAARENLAASQASLTESRQAADTAREERERLVVDVAEQQQVHDGLLRLCKDLEARHQALEADEAEWQTRLVAHSELAESMRVLEAKRHEEEQRLADEVRSRDTALGSLQVPFFEVPVAGRSLDLSEEEFLTDFQRYLGAAELNFPDRLVRSFHTALKIQDVSSLVVLAGISGTGKSQLPRRYAEFAGMQSLMVSVQPRWDSPQDLLGFYNYVEGKFKPTELARAMVELQSAGWEDRMLLVLLDEMNLARVEHYFSDFLSRLEGRRPGEDVYVELDLGGMKVDNHLSRVRLDHRLLFVGTMNEDESTQTLSDKVLDRASVITFPRPNDLTVARATVAPFRTLDGYVSTATFASWRRAGASTSFERETWIMACLRSANEVMAAFDRPFGHRVSQSVLSYVVEYPGVAAETTAVGPRTRAAMADQLAQKIIPKLRGIPLDAVNRGRLDRFMDEVVDRVDDAALSAAFHDARTKSHVFTWRGLDFASPTLRA